MKKNDLALTAPNTETKDKKVVYGRDGRKMHKNSLKNLGPVPKNGFDKNPQNINRSGAPIKAEKRFRRELLRILESPDSPGVKKTKLTALVERVVFMAQTTENDGTFLRLTEIIKDSLDGKSGSNQTNLNPIVHQNIVILPTRDGKLDAEALQKLQNRGQDSQDSAEDADYTETF